MTQAFLLNLIETGIVSETKHGKTRWVQIKTSVFGTSNNIKKKSTALQSRFFIVELKAYTYQQFCDITEQLLSRQNIERELANSIANAVWNKSQDVRDCIKIGTISKSYNDVEFILSDFLK